MARQLINRVVAPAAGAAALAGLGTAATGSYFARRILTPERQVEDQQIHSLRPGLVELTRTAESQAPGRYGLSQDSSATFARVGPVLDSTRETVTRVLEDTDFGQLREGPARLNSYYFAGPPARSLGVPLIDELVDAPIGPLPAWRTAGDSDRWAILVHGRGASRAECLRAVPVLHENGLQTLIPSYRNDIGAPRSPDGKFHLGLTEWQDVEAAVRFAVDAGAAQILLFGWSMGGAVVLQFLNRSSFSARVSGVVLDAPVVDWSAVFAFHAAENHLPSAADRTGRWLMRQRGAHRAVGLGESLDLRRTNWVARADELTVPTLLIHSADDEFVPYGPSQDLAAARPDLVHLETWHGARHCREWNVDSGRWDDLVGRFSSDTAGFVAQDAGVVARGESPAGP